MKPAVQARSLTSVHDECRRGACADAEVRVGGEQLIQLLPDGVWNLEADRAAA